MLLFLSHTGVERVEQVRVREVFHETKVIVCARKKEEKKRTNTGIGFTRQIQIVAPLQAWKLGFVKGLQREQGVGRRQFVRPFDAATTTVFTTTSIVLALVLLLRAGGVTVLAAAVVAAAAVSTTTVPHRSWLIENQHVSQSRPGVRVVQRCW